MTGTSESVRAMFTRIAGRYDLMNSVMTGGRHHAWRRLTAGAIAAAPEGPAALLALGAALGFVFFVLAMFGAVGALPKLALPIEKIPSVNELGAFVLGVVGGWLGRRFLGAGGPRTASRVPPTEEEHGPERTVDRRPDSLVER